MFTQKITDADPFTDMPSSAQALYFHLNLAADDDGFCNKIKICMQKAKAGDDDLRLLIAKSFIIPFESGIVVIKHWRMHNLLRKDRYHETDYIDEKEQLFIKENGAYTLNGKNKNKQLATEWQPNGNQMAPEDRLGKDSIGKVSIDKGLKDVSAEPETVSTPTVDSPTVDSPTVISLILNDGSLYPITQYVIDQLKPLYPAVDIEAELKKMAGWLLGNSVNRKTQKGIMRFVTNWLSKAQDRAKTYLPARTENFTERKYTPDEMKGFFNDIHDVDNINF